MNFVIKPTKTHSFELKRPEICHNSQKSLVLIYKMSRIESLYQNLIFLLDYQMRVKTMTY